ncbi:CBS domain-containing protein [Streptomyces sp. NPDC006624]|uniref:CBS domain-containing protein n=1 Tax=unclassified Streptomyces TaxID=2593676 RepID=UPI0033B8B703
MSGRDTREAGRASADARRTLPALAGEPAEEFRQDLMVRYLRAMASTARTAEPVQEATGPAAAPRQKPLTDLQVFDIMRRSVPVASVDAGTPLLDVARTLARSKAGAVPVLDDERRVVGVVAESDLLARVASLTGPEEEPGLFGKLFGRRRGEDAGDTAATLMTAPALTVHPWTTVAAAAREAARSRIRQVFVTDHSGRLAGVVTRNELLHALVRDDAAVREEIVSRVFDACGVDPARVAVRVRNGVVTLTGVLAADRIPALTDALARIPDVDEVENLLAET